MESFHNRKLVFPILILFGFLATSILAIKFPWDDEDSSEHNSGSNSIFPFHIHKNFSHNKNASKFGSHWGPNKTHGGHGGLDVDFYNIFTSFVNQTRQTIPDIANHGNFSLIQLGLLCAIGAMAAGVSLVAAEGFAFRNHETEVEKYNYYQHLLELQSQQPSDSYGPPSTSYGVPMTKQDNGIIFLRQKRSRVKRQSEDQDSGELPYHHEIVKPYSSSGGSFANSQKNNPQLHTNSNPNFLTNAQIPQYPVYSLMYNSPLMANTAYQLAQLQQSYPFPENNPHHRRHGVDKIRRKYQDLSSDAEFSRGIPLVYENAAHEFRKESRKKKKRLRGELFRIPEDPNGNMNRKKFRRRKDESH